MWGCRNIEREQYQEVERAFQMDGRHQCTIRDNVGRNGKSRSSLMPTFPQSWRSKTHLQYSPSMVSCFYHHHGRNSQPPSQRLERNLIDIARTVALVLGDSPVGVVWLGEQTTCHRPQKLHRDQIPFGRWNSSHPRLDKWHESIYPRSMANARISKVPGLYRAPEDGKSSYEN